MLRVLLCLICLMLTPSALRAATPAEPPPPGFLAAQYIDSTGCVFRRQDGDWTPVTDRDGVVACGFPPSLSSRRQGPDSEVDLLKPTAGDPMQRIESELMQAVTAEFGAAHGGMTPPPLPNTLAAAHAAPRPPAVRSADGPMGEIAAEMAAMPGMQAVMGAGLSPRPRLCSLLGMHENPGRRLALGSDPTGGYCSDSGSKPRVAMEVAADAPKAGSAHVVASLPTAAKVAENRHDAKPRAKSAKKASPKQRAFPARNTTAQQPGIAKTQGQEMVPPGARYVQVVRTAENATATRIVGQIRAAGYGVVREKVADGKPAVIMAGPFATRERLISALGRLRRAGFPGATAR